MTKAPLSHTTLGEVREHGPLSRICMYNLCVLMLNSAVHTAPWVGSLCTPSSFWSWTAPSLPPRIHSYVFPADQPIMCQLPAFNSFKSEALLGRLQLDILYTGHLLHCMVTLYISYLNHLIPWVCSLLEMLVLMWVQDDYGTRWLVMVWSEVTKVGDDLGMICPSQWQVSLTRE